MAGDGEAYVLTGLPSGSGESLWNSFLLSRIFPVAASTAMT
jgi:hypothetical protein